MADTFYWISMQHKVVSTTVCAFTSTIFRVIVCFLIGLVTIAFSSTIALYFFCFPSIGFSNQQPRGSPEGMLVIVPNAQVLLTTKTYFACHKTLLCLFLIFSRKMACMYCLDKLVERAGNHVYTLKMCLVTLHSHNNIRIYCIPMPFFLWRCQLESTYFPAISHISSSSVTFHGCIYSF